MEQQKPRIKERALVFVVGGMGSGKDRMIDKIVDSGKLGAEGSYVVIGPSTIKNLLEKHEGELEQASPTSLDPETFGMLQRVKEAYGRRVLHPEKLPENIDAYNRVVHAAAVEAIHHNKSIVINTHGDNVSLIEDIVGAACTSEYNAHIMMVQMNMRPQDAYQMGEDRISEGKLRRRDLPRLLESHKASRYVAPVTSHYVDITVAFSRRHDPDPEKRAPELAVIHEPNETHGRVSTIINRDHDQDSTLWKHASTEAKTFEEFQASLREPEVRNSMRVSSFFTDLIPSPEQRAIREFAEELLGVSFSQSRSR